MARQHELEIKRNSEGNQCLYFDGRSLGCIPQSDLKQIAYAMANYAEQCESEAVTMSESGARYQMLVAKRMAANPRETRSMAELAVIRTAEGLDLYERARAITLAHAPKVH